MKRLFFSCLVGTIALSGFLDRLAVAEHPEFLRHFHIVPRLSRLGITGGFAGVNERYRLIGEYDFASGYDHGDPWGGFASFENAEVWGSLISDLPTIAIVLDVDERLNLEGLKGERLPVAAPFDVFKFTGQTSDGSDLTLFASVLGPWMYVRGGSFPPQGGADFFDYHLRMVARSRPFADMNDDGVVDLADYTVLRDSLGGASASAAVDGIGVSEWRTQFGEQVPDFGTVDAIADAAFAKSGSGTAAVPEPSAIVLVLAILLCAGINVRLAR